MPRLDRYQDPNIYEILAGDYVLGVLKGRARRRFEVLMNERPYLRQAVELWEQRLGPLNAMLPPASPPAGVWKRIQLELDSDEVAREGPKRTVWDNLLAWRITALAAVIGLAVLLGNQLLSQRPEHTPMPTYMAVLTSDKDTPMFVATVSKQPMGMTLMRVSEEVSLPPEKELKVWCLMNDGSKVMPMGMLSSAKETHFSFNEHDWDLMEKTSGLAISAEPKDEERGDRPSGPILYSGKFVSMI